MVGYKIPADANNYALGTYYVKKKTYSRGDKRGETVTKVFQVKKRADSDSHYWSKINPKKLEGDKPRQLTSRALHIRDPTQQEIDSYETHNVFVYTAHDVHGHHPTSLFKLKRRKDGDEYKYYWGALSAKQRAERLAAM